MTICHEFSHVLGLPDFYDTDYEGSGGESHHPGDWSVMAGGNHLNNSRTPCAYSLYERMAVGFTEPMVINAKGHYTLILPVGKPSTRLQMGSVSARQWYAGVPSG